MNNLIVLRCAKVSRLHLSFHCGRHIFSQHLILGCRCQLWPVVWHLTLLPLLPTFNFSSMSFPELRRKRNKQNKLLFKLVRIQLCSLYCSNTYYPSLCRMTVFQLHSHKSKITLQFFTKRWATDVCVSLMQQNMHCLTSNQIMTTETSPLLCVLHACGLHW